MQTLLKTTQAYRLLKTECGNGEASHAYLLWLDDSRSLREALHTFAKIFLDCDEESTVEETRRARLIDEDGFADCLYFPAEGKKLSVEDAESIQEESTLAPVEGKKKLFLLGDFALANVQTQNKLLKLLEEPPQGVIFLLGTTSLFPVLSTVLSRTKKLEIQPFSTQEVFDCLHRLYGNTYDEDTLRLCAIASNGCVGKAKNILEEGYYQTLTEQAFSLATASKAQLPTLVKQVGETKRQRELLGLLRLIFRDAVMCKLSYSASKQEPLTLLLKHERERLEKIAQTYSFSALLYAQEAISQAEKQVQFNAVFPQCIELCMANIIQRNAQDTAVGKQTL